ncbi:MAG: trehalose-phosphatase [Candidatus Margulisbacteria bacterium]|nr:trehalose-phosphatase [Candidatus Margulisiibacteriota bacterium]
MKQLLLLDYDGTLTPIKKHPKLARLSPNRKILLRKLARHPEIRMAIISGRKLADIKKMVGIPGLIYVGNHGFEIDAGGKYWLYPAAKKFIARLKTVKAALKKNIRYRGVFIEDKGLTLSVHYRLLSEKVFSAFKALFTRTVKSWGKTIKLTHGKKVFEIRPPINWNKGKAIKWIIKRLKLKKHLPIYIGDDRTDEDAFRALKKKGITILVGKNRKTAAIFTLNDINDVYKFLTLVSEP